MTILLYKLMETYIAPLGIALCIQLKYKYKFSKLDHLTHSKKKMLLPSTSFSPIKYVLLLFCFILLSVCPLAFTVCYLTKLVVCKCFFVSFFFHFPSYFILGLVFLFSVFFLHVLLMYCHHW